MDKSITAEWARKKAEEIIGEKASEQISKCESAIKIAVSNNKFSCNIGILLEDRVVYELEQRGFKMIKHSSNRPMENDYYEIKWR